MPDASDLTLLPELPENIESMSGIRSRSVSYMSRILKSFSGDLREMAIASPKLSICIIIPLEISQNKKSKFTGKT